jgi:hypothetical protein
MSTIYRTLLFILITGITACAANQSTMIAAGDEDKDIGLGGTGMLADTGNGLGGTGILGEITGFGSIFVNGIEVEYDDTTAFTIDGKTAMQQPLEIGDVVEVLTTDETKHTQARTINLRHEVIGKVESTDPQTFSFTVLGQTVVQSLNNRMLPDVGTTVAVSGFRVDQHTIISTRVTSADTTQTLLRTHTELPFDKETSRWLVQTYVQDDKASFQLNGSAQVITVKNKVTGALKDHMEMRVLQLQRADSKSDSLELEQVIEPDSLPRGRQTSRHGQTPAIQTRPGSKRGYMPGAMPVPIQKNTQPVNRSSR